MYFLTRKESPTQGGGPNIPGVPFNPIDSIYYPLSISIPVDMVQPVPQVPSVDTTIKNPGASIPGSLTDIGGGQLTYFDQWGPDVSQFPTYPAAEVEAGRTIYLNAQDINEYVRSGLWDRSVIDHVWKWNTYWMKQTGTWRTYRDMHPDWPMVQSYEAWEAYFRDNLFKGL
jgi:hypothetical protein